VRQTSLAKERSRGANSKKADLLIGPKEVSIMQLSEEAKLEQQAPGAGSAAGASQGEAPAAKVESAITAPSGKKASKKKASKKKASKKKASKKKASKKKAQEEGLQEEGLQEEGFQEEGFQEEGFQEEGFQEEGFQEEGLQEEGFQEEGLQEEGFQEEGFQEEGFQEEGLQEEGLQEEGFQEEGFEEEEGFQEEEGRSCRWSLRQGARRGRCVARRRRGTGGQRNAGASQGGRGPACRGPGQDLRPGIGSPEQHRQADWPAMIAGA
jgi:hypothetical protein